MQYHTLCANLVPYTDRRVRAPGSTHHPHRSPPSSWSDFLRVTAAASASALATAGSSQSRSGESHSHGNAQGKRMRSATSHNGSQDHDDAPLRPDGKRPKVRKTVTFVV